MQAPHVHMMTSTAINGKRTEVAVGFDVKEYGMVNVFDREVWQGTIERGGYVRFTDAVVVEDLPQVTIEWVAVEGKPVKIDDTQRKLIAYQLVNEMPHRSEFFIGAMA